MSTNPNFRQRLVSQRHCSYCLRAGHNIKSCDDGRLLVFDINLKHKKEVFRLLNHNLQNEKQEMNNWLHNQNQHLTKGYAIRFCDSRVNNAMTLHIQKIIDKIYPPYDIPSFNLYENENEELNNNEIYDEQVNNEDENHQVQHNNEINEIVNTEQSEQTISNNNIDNIFDSNLNNGDNGEYNEQALINEIIHYLTSRITFEDMNLLDNLVQIIIENRMNNRKKIELCYKVDIITKKQSKKYCECNICYENKQITNFIEYNCGHYFCLDCVKEIINIFKQDEKKYICCALCRENIEIFKFLKINRNKYCVAKETLNNYLLKEII